MLVIPMATRVFFRMSITRMQTITFAKIAPVAPLLARYLV
tara:strand:+ start:253 stop:372 length:120 start_codon:yes stop_codon:yes gene_type:complete